jgi:molybdate/tungstate transport system permease protein
VSWAASPAAADRAVQGRRAEPSGQPGPGRRGSSAGRLRIRSVSGALSIGGALAIWVALLGPVITLLTHLSWHSIVTSLDYPGALDPLVTSLEAGGVTLAVLLFICTPLSWMLARGTLPFPRVWEAGVLCALLLPPLVIGLLLVFMVGPYSAIGELIGHLNLTATNTFLALVIAEVYESAPYYVVGAQAAFSAVNPRLEEQAALLGDRPLRVLRRVTMPLASPGLAMALAVAWARAMGAFGAVIIIAYHPYGLPLQIYTTLEQTGLPSALPYALVLLVVALPLPVAAYVWSARAQSRRRG